MKTLLPYQYKKAGITILPLGILLWILIQKKIIYRDTMPFIHIKAAVSGVF